MKSGFKGLRRGAVRALSCLSLALLVACGGGGDEDDDGGGPSGGGGGGGGGTTTGNVWAIPPAPPAPPATGSTVAGLFRDANVAGIEYQSGDVSGVTGADGRFQYVVGQNVTFKLGGVPLGSVPGMPLVTPLHLPSDLTSSIANQVDNRLRFLQMLDADGNPENGIEISEAVRARAVDWPPVDFTTAPGDLAATLAAIRADAQSADGGTHAVPTVDAARAHFARTFWCTHSGIFRGVFSGADTGVFSIVSYRASLLRGMAYSNVEHEAILLENTTPLALSLTPDFIAGEGNNGATFTGDYDNLDTIGGTWRNGTSTGAFLGFRVPSGIAAPVYRISGYQFPLGTMLLFNLEIDAENHVAGHIVDMNPSGSGVPVAVTGSLAGTALTLSTTAGTYTLANGVFDPAAVPGMHQLTGTLRDNVHGRDVALTLPGCRLN